MASDCSTPQFHRQYRAFLADLRGKLLGKEKTVIAGETKAK
jgi:hypothetical protein